MSRVLSVWRESYAAKRSYGGSAGLSLVAHLGVIGLAVLATRHAPEKLKDQIEEIRVLFHIPEDRMAGREAPQQERIQWMTVGVAPGTGPLVDLPSGQPDGGQGSELSLGGRFGNPDVDLSKLPAIPGVDSAYSILEVDSVVTRDPFSAAPAYPAELLSAGVTGSALVDYVVDTTGRVDMRTFTTVRSSHKLFTEAVREALPLMRFTPAKIGSNVVRQLVEQEFFFRIDKPAVRPVAQLGATTRPEEKRLP